MRMTQCDAVRHSARQSNHIDSNCQIKRVSNPEISLLRLRRETLEMGKVLQMLRNQSVTLAESTLGFLGAWSTISAYVNLCPHVPGFKMIQFHHNFTKASR